MIDTETDRILDGTVLGTGGDEAIHTSLDMMANCPPRTGCGVQSGRVGDRFGGLAL